MILAVAMSAVSLYYYLQVLKQIYVAEETKGNAVSPPSLFTQGVVALLAASVVLLGCAPNLLVGRIVQAIKLAGL